jgi:UDP-N-acetylglucosamine transferase subunit ALG13
METSGPTPLVLLVVGTDHHPFDRAVGWVDAWAARRGDAARVVVQFGTSRPPAHCEAHDFLRVDELDALMREAGAVVSHGGPGTIMGARAAGSVPIVIPRRAELGEHVDDHQVRFTARLAEAGQIHLADGRATLEAMLDRALIGELGFRVDAEGADHAAEAAARLGSLVDQMLTRG